MRLALLSLLVAITSGLSAQVIAVQNYDDPNTWDSYVLSTPDCTDGSDSWTSTAVNPTASGSTTPALAATNYFFIRDLNGNCGSAAGETITVSETLTGTETDLEVSFDYEVIGYDNTDNMFYTITVNGVPEPEVQFITGGNNLTTSGTIVASIPDNTTSVTLEIRVVQNGDDRAGIDNITLRSAGPDGTCGIAIDPTSSSFTCQSASASDDPVTFSLSYTGVEPGFTYSIDAITPGVPAPVITGDNPAIDVDGTIEVTLQEGASYTFTFGSVDCGSQSVPVTVPANFCTPPPASVVINEFLPDPASDINGDGTASTTQDEFIEVYNTATTATDISGWSITDGVALRHVFPAGSVLLPGQAFTVFGGGTPDNAACFQTASTGSLGLNNGSDQITLFDANNIQRDAFSYSGSSDDITYAREIDGIGNFVQHNTIASNPVNNSPCQSNNLPATLLPVELTSFTAAADAKNNVRLSWATAREENSDRFEVQWSADGVRFATLETLAAANTSFGADYALLDERGVTGMNYYRLRQVDFDGREEFFGPVVVELTGGELNVFPNPTTDLLNVRGVDAGATTEVLDLNGRVVLRAPMNGGGISVAALPSGTYLLRVRDARASRTVRFVRR